MKPKHLNIFNSDFGIRANLKIKELEIQAFGKQIKIFNQEQNKNQKTFAIHMGPPYANGSIHIGHALNIILKDFSLRFHWFQNYQTMCLPGGDGHGLPVALAIEKQSPNPLLKKQTVVFRNKCLNFAQQQVQKQIKQLQRLGTQIDFHQQYLTFDKNYVSSQLRIFAKMVAKNLIFSSVKPVYGSGSSQTALADTEVEYLEKKDNAIFVLFPLENETTSVGKDTFFLVGTTTTGTIPENKFLAIKSDGEYILIKVKEKKIIIAKSALSRLQKELNGKNVAIIKTGKGKELINLKYHHPYLNFTSNVINSEHVSLEEGTGIVHIAPAFGLEDFHLVHQKMNIICPMDKNGYFTKAVFDKDLKGIFYENTEAIILEKIKKEGNLLFIKAFQHQYPHDGRTKKPVIYRATKQGYLNLQPLRKNIQKIINQAQGIPDGGKKKISKIIENRQDGCLSRQRSGGTPIPIFFNKKQEPVLNSEIINHIADLISKNGDNIGGEGEIKALLTEKQIQNYQIVSKFKDTFDVGFDSGCSAAIINSQQATKTIIGEGNDQYRGGFNSLIIVSAALNKNFSIDQVLAHGFVNDEFGKKMSKSKGNVVDPLEICQIYGADILRLGVASRNYFEDLSLSKNLINNVAKNYVKIRNTIRFLINNLTDFDWEKNYCKKLTTIDYGILIKLNVFIDKVTKHFKNYQFHLAYLLITFFVTNDLSNFYFDYAKNILYSEHHDAIGRRQIQTTLHHILKTFLIILAPILTHTTEEAYQIGNKKQLSTSVHFLKGPNKITFASKSNIILQGHFIQQLKTEVNKMLEEAIQTKKIRKFQETKIFINYHPQYQLFKNETEYQKFLTEFNLSPATNGKEMNLIFTKKLPQIAKITNLHRFFKVQEIIFTNQERGKKYPIAYLDFIKNNSQLCQRCNLNLVNKNSDNCTKCEKILNYQ